MKMNFYPLGTENVHPISNATDSSFVLLLQQAALLGLKDAGQLNEMQHRQAEKSLLGQYKDTFIKIHGVQDSHD